MRCGNLRYFVKSLYDINNHGKAHMVQYIK